VGAAASGLGHAAQDRLGVAGAIGGEGREVVITQGEQAGRDRHGDAVDRAGVQQHGVQERARSAAVAVGERVDGLELDVGQRSVGEGRQVVAVHETHEISHQSGHLGGGRWHVVRVTRVERRTTHPDLLLAPGA
jgi:hypothetical protein